MRGSKRSPCPPGAITTFRALTLVLIGFPLLWLFGGIAFLVMVWFTVMSAIGMIKLLDGRTT